ncbi:MAG TPA: triose-phosphate isomerase [Bacteroidota bacterium]|nr:triose-phosphate isomerase [Bacteroidota bacterium]
MRKKLIAGNWKMYKTIEETIELINALKPLLASRPPDVTVVVCPPFTSLVVAANLLKDTPIGLGAQNMSEHDEGAYTGEISWKMLKSAGCSYVILGHSERRQYFGETNELINRKAKKALAAGLMPIICVGERLEEREQGITQQVVAAQVRGVLAGISSDEMKRVVIAYEPVWAIGTGRNATPMQAQEVHREIRKLVAQLYSWPVAESLVIQYGGSVKPENAGDLLAQDDIDGALVGGACLKADSFAAIVRSAPVR